MSLHNCFGFALSDELSSGAFFLLAIRPVFSVVLALIHWIFCIYCGWQTTYLFLNLSILDIRSWSSELQDEKWNHIIIKRKVRKVVFSRKENAQVESESSKSKRKVNILRFTTACLSHSSMWWRFWLMTKNDCLGSCRYKRWGHGSKKFPLTSISYWRSCMLFKAPFPPLLHIYSVFCNFPCFHDRFLSFHWSNFVPRVFSHKLSHRTR